MGFGQSGFWTLKLTVSQEWSGEINCFLHAGTNLCNLKMIENFGDEHGQKWVRPVW